MFGYYRSFNAEGDGFSVSFTLKRDIVDFNLHGASVVSERDGVRVSDYVNSEAGFIGCIASQIPDFMFNDLLEKTVRFIEDNIDLVLDSTGTVRYANANRGTGITIIDL